MKNKITWLRISYWVGAIADFGLSISTLAREEIQLTIAKRREALSKN